MQPRYKNKRIIMNFCYNQPGGLGDVSHQINLFKPVTLKKIADKIKIAADEKEWKNEHYFQPVYVTACDDNPKTLQNIIQKYRSAGLIWVEPEFKEEIDDKNIKRYLIALTKANPHLHIIPFQNIDDDWRGATHRAETAVAEYIKDNPQFREQINKTCYAPLISTSCPTLSQCVAKSGFALELPFLETWLGEQGAGTADSPVLHAMGFAATQHGIIMEDIFQSPESMHADHVLELRARLFTQLKDKQYIAALLGIYSDNAKLFLQRNLFIPGYFQPDFTSGDDLIDNFKFPALFINSLAISAEAAKYEDGVVFHINQCPVELLLDKTLLAENGYSTVTVHSPSKVPEEIHLAGATGKKKLIIMNGFRFDDPDYESLFKIAQTFSGGSGDTTFQFPFAQGLIPFYQERMWKRAYNFIISFHRLAEKFLKTTFTHTTDTEAVNAVLSYIRTFQGVEYIPATYTTKVLPPAREGYQFIANFINDDFIKKWKALIHFVQKNYNYLDKFPQFLCEGVSFGLLCEAAKHNQFDEVEKNLARFKQSDMLILYVTALERSQSKVAAMIVFHFPDILPDIIKWHITNKVQAVDYCALFDVSTTEHQLLKSPSETLLTKINEAFAASSKPKPDLKELQRSLQAEWEKIFSMESKQENIMLSLFAKYSKLTIPKDPHPESKIDAFLYQLLFQLKETDKAQYPAGAAQKDEYAAEKYSILKIVYHTAVEQILQLGKELQIKQEKTAGGIKDEINPDSSSKPRF